MAELKFTIITRVYNTEKYLSQSIESVLAQDYSNWELILINDGSSDNSGDICEEYAKKDNRIKYIIQKNQGGAKAQLAGFRAASGDYIFTLDSDDTFEQDTLSFCHDKITETPDVDILLFGMNQYSEGWEFIKHQPFIDKDTVFDKIGFIKYVLKTTIHGLIKILKRSLIEYTEWERDYFDINGSYFSLNNDILIGFPTLLKAEKAMVIPQCFYNYRLSESSCSHIDKPYKKIDVAFRTYDYLTTLFAKNGLSADDIHALVLYEVAREIINSIRSIIKKGSYDKSKIIAIKSDKRFETVADAFRTKKINNFFSVRQKFLFYFFYRFIYHQNYNIHIIPDSPYSIKFIEEAEKSFPTIINKYYCIDKSFQHLKCKENDGVVWLKGPLAVLGLIFILNRSSAKTIYLHFLDMKKTFLALFVVAKKKIIWGYWGGDLYNYIDYDLYDEETSRIYRPRKETSLIARSVLSILLKFRTFVINNKINYVTMKLQNEFDMLKRFYPKSHIERIDFEYQNPISFTDNERSPGQKKEKISILLGNSGDPANNHVSIIRKLARLTVPVDVFCPLSYGNADYIKQVIEIGKAELKDSFKPLLSFMNPREYQNFLATVDVAIMNHHRQQGLGNIRFLLENGSRVFLNKKNPLYSYFFDKGIEIGDIEAISDSMLKKTLSNNQTERNKRTIRDLFGEAYYEKSMKTLFMMDNGA